MMQSFHSQVAAAFISLQNEPWSGWMIAVVFSSLSDVHLKERILISLFHSVTGNYSNNNDKKCAVNIFRKSVYPWRQCY